MAEKRTNGLIQKVRLLGNLGNTPYYEYTDKQVKKIFSAIEKELDAARSQFKKSYTDFDL